MLSLASGALTFLLSPVGRYVVVGLMVLAAYGAGFGNGHHKATKRCQDAALQSRIDAMHTDLRAANEAAAAAEQARKEIEEASASDRKRIAEYEKLLAARPSGACALTDDDVRWLSDDKPNRK